MAMGTRRQRQRQEQLWYRDLAGAPGHPFWRKLNQVLDEAGFDKFCEERCEKFYHEKLGRPSLTPGTYFRVMLIGFFEESRASEVLRGEWPIRCVCGSFCRSDWMSGHQTMSPSRARDGCCCGK